MSYALDASAILLYLDNEAGAERVEEIIQGHLQGADRAVVSAIHWGEIAGCIYRRHGRQGLNRILARLNLFAFEIVPVDSERAVRAAVIKIEVKIPYVDALGVELARSENCIFVTADFDLKAATDEARIEFLSRK